MFIFKNIKFIYTANLGLHGFTFNDFGDDFLINESNGPKNK